jgi:hypothetical protein
LVDHKKGWDYDGRPVEQWRRLWTEVLTRLGRRVPTSGWQWYCFYNGLDAAWTLELGLILCDKLDKQGRFSYYKSLMAPLQAPLLDMGLRGMPVDERRLAIHRTACQRLQRMASRILKGAGQEMLKLERDELQLEVSVHERNREVERSSGLRKYSQSRSLSSTRTKLRTKQKNLDDGFNFNSSHQAVALLYGWYGLPEVRNRKTKGPTTDDDAIESLIRRMTRVDEHGTACPTVKPKRGNPADVLQILKAIEAGRKWNTWESSYLSPELKR